MAMNPMQRRARNSFLIGFLVALIIMSMAVLFLVYKIKSINEAKEALEQKQIKVYVASDDLKSGEVVTLDDDFTMSTVQTTVDKSKIISEEDFQFLDDSGNPQIKLNEDGSEKVKEMVMKINVPAGTIVTKDMIVEAGDETSKSHRIQEYNMISLPSRLKNGDYIDVRISLPNGQDYVVLAKKRVIGTTSTTVWLRLDELEIELMNSAIVDSYMYTGSKLYASQLSEAGMQEPLEVTYTARLETVALINKNPNILLEARNNYFTKYNENATARTDYFEKSLSTIPLEEQQAMVNAGNSNEIEAVKTARQDYVSQLDGTDDVGYNSSAAGGTN